MIGTKIHKTLKGMKEYTPTAMWCNQNNAHIEDKGEYYEVVENEAIEPAPIMPSEAERLDAIEEAIAELAEIIAGGAE